MGFTIVYAVYAMIGMELVPMDKSFPTEKACNEYVSRSNVRLVCGPMPAFYINVKF